MAYVHPSTRPIHLGLRARLRATREALMASPRARGRLHGDHGELRAAALSALGALDGHGAGR
jgi:hypothetical protein